MRGRDYIWFRSLKASTLLLVLLMILWSSEATPGLEVGKGAERDGLPRLDVRVKRHTNPNETTHQYTGGNSCRDGGKAETKGL